MQENIAKYTVSSLGGVHKHKACREKYTGYFGVSFMIYVNVLFSTFVPMPFLSVSYMTLVSPKQNNEKISLPFFMTSIGFQSSKE